MVSRVLPVLASCTLRASIPRSTDSEHSVLHDYLESGVYCVGIENMSVCSTYNVSGHAKLLCRKHKNADEGHGCLVIILDFSF